MRTAHNKPYIQKCIVSFSHDRCESRKQANALSVAKASKEIAQGKKGISHLILRAKDDEIDQLKFLFLIHGIPIMCYALGNLLLSSLKEIVVVGSHEIKQALDAFLETVDTQGKIIKFALEDPDNLSLTNTMLLGYEQLAPDPDEMILFQPGDVPFLYDFENVIRDKDIANYNLILWTNSREKMFPKYKVDPGSEFVQRNYHYRSIYDDDGAGVVHEIKEPNIYPINLSAIESDIIELLHSSRKDGKILKAGLIKAMSKPGRLFEIFPLMINTVLFFDRRLKKLRPNDTYQFGMQKNVFDRIASLLLNTPFTSKIHEDPAFVSDIDALEDWEDFESMTHYAWQKHGEEGLTLIHPFGSELLQFRDKAMPGLMKELPIYHDFPAYINAIYQTLEMDYVPYDLQGNYSLPEKRKANAERAYLWYSNKSEKIKIWR